MDSILTPPIERWQIKTVAIVQARMSSKRLPGKVMMDIAGKPMLFHVVSRVQKAQKIDHVVVATSNHYEEDTIEKFCRRESISCFRGSLDDVLDRYYRAASLFAAEVIVRLTADCPLLDHDLIDQVVHAFHSGHADYASNALECTYPDGLDTEVFSRSVLENTWQNAKLKSEREHVTPYIYKHPEQFRIVKIKHSENLSHFRWTVDDHTDLEFVRSIFECMGKLYFGMTDVLNLLQQHPEICQLNSNARRNEGYLKSLKQDNLKDNRRHI
ncbi:MAG: glycosyltransferase family protein [Syntrophales bacterium]